MSGNQGTMGKDIKQLTALPSPLLSSDVACGPATISASVLLADSSESPLLSLHSKSWAAKVPIPATPPPPPPRAPAGVGSELCGVLKCFKYKF